MSNILAVWKNSRIRWGLIIAVLVLVVAIKPELPIYLMKLALGLIFLFIKAVWEIGVSAFTSVWSFITDVYTSIASFIDSIVWTVFATVFGGFAGGTAGLLAVTLWLKDRHRQNNPFKLNQASYYEEYGADKKSILRLVLTNNLNRTLDVSRVALMLALRHRIEQINGETFISSTRTYRWNEHEIQNKSSEIKYNETLTIDFKFNVHKKAVQVMDEAKSIMIITKSGEWYVPLNSIKHERIKVGEKDYSDFSYTILGRFLMHINHFAWKHCPNDWLKQKLFRGVG